LSKFPAQHQAEARPALSVRNRIIWGIVLVAGLILVYTPNLSELMQIWWSDPDYSHGFAIPVIALFIARKRFEWGRASWTGITLFAAILALRACCFERGEFWLETVSLLPALAALAWGIGGRGLAVRLVPAIAYLIFMFPIPPRVESRLSLPLQGIASNASGQVLRLAGVWVLDEGNVLDLGHDRLEVATACNGLAMLMSLSATVVAIVSLVPMSRGKRVLLLFSALPIAVVCNVLRIVVTAYCYQRFGPVVGGKFAHDVAGWMMMPLALAIIAVELAWSSWIFRREPAAEVAPRHALPTHISIAPTH
jgi:exosortase